ncbi:beta-ketoacyl-[acyl-carrier-protein] synthase family protein [Nocardia sp. NPDC020380]|uniref:beta-ketoacyl-[acyl-carrier-protein] synthase family protein n=1 Tax=Nocardia sp. NPDC020380 TaxID=3364309 RepID=UPI0037B1BC15
MRRRVVITGVGVIAPGGIGAKSFLELLSSGVTATRRISFFDPGAYRSQVAAECDFDPVAQGLTPQQIRRMDRAAQFALVSAREAWQDSGLEADDIAPEDLGVSLGSAVGCTMSLEREYAVVSDGGAHWLVNQGYAVPHLFDYLVPSSMAIEVARDLGAEGPVALISTGCTSGLDSIKHARDLIMEGSAEVVLAGGADAPISPITVACFDSLRATTPSNDDPEHASRPFDRRRNGFVLGEGAAFLVLEEWHRARARGAHIYAEIVGAASRSNAFHMTGLRPDGREMAAAITSALDEARLDPTAVDYINAHGSGTKQNDHHETSAFKASLGSHAYRTPVSSIKSMIGHSLGAIGSIEMAACALAIEHSVVPPTANLLEPSPECDLDYVPLQARAQQLNTILSVGSGFGGFQSAIVLVAPDRAAA